MSDVNTALTDLKQRYNVAISKSNKVTMLSIGCRARLQAIKWVDRMQKYIEKAKVNYDIAAALSMEEVTCESESYKGALWRHAKPRYITRVVLMEMYFWYMRSPLLMDFSSKSIPINCETVNGSFDEVRALIESKPDDAIIATHPLAIKLQADYDTTHKWKITFKNSMPHVSTLGKKAVFH